MPSRPTVPVSFSRETRCSRDSRRKRGASSFTLFRPRDLEQSFADIANELRHQYFILYSPNNFEPDGSFHKIRVKARVKDTVVRVRRGYYAPLPGEERR